MKTIFLLLILLIGQSFCQQLPIVVSNSEKLTGYEELSDFLSSIEGKHKFGKINVIGKTVEGRNIYSFEFSKEGINPNTYRLKVLVFAQQHGNEHSGKEAAIMLISDFVDGKFDPLLENLDIAIIPQINPDGSEKDKRRNGNNADLNRNHLTLTQPESIALHNYFNKILFDLTLDVHEYFPFSSDWRNFGFYKIADEQLGLLTNPNISTAIKKFSKEQLYPFVEKYLIDKGFRFNEYIVGGPPNIERLRHSTTDINDGRQSFGIQGSLSFILEGINGEKNSADGIEKRSKGQYEAIVGLLNIANKKHEEIKTLVKNERDYIVNKKSTLSLRGDHFNNGQIFRFPVRDAFKGIDTIISSQNYNPVVKSLLDIDVPIGWLIPKNDSKLNSLITYHNIKSEELESRAEIIEYEITSLDSIFLEGEWLRDVKIKETLKSDLNLSEYFFLPSKQIKKITLNLAFHPQSMHSIIQYDDFEYLLRNKIYPIKMVR
ncbi:MAG TPA: M14 family zinc carboxypeptidase [Ignavibacteriaceae bacterium]|nr:M14 family zinc carboxypeptidase [Ignavibacteriaceae bacterium]